MAVPILDWPTNKYLHCPAIPGIKYEIKNIIKKLMYIEIILLKLVDNWCVIWRVYYTIKQT